MTLALHTSHLSKKMLTTLEFYKKKNIEEFLSYFHLENQMSGFEISEMIKKDLDIKISPRTFERWARVLKIQRPQRAAINLARNKQRIPYHRRSLKGLYDKRDINYIEVQGKRSETMMRNVPLMSLFVFGLREALLKNNQRPEDLTEYLRVKGLRVENNTVEAWASLGNRCNVVYHDALIEFIGWSFDELFDVRKADGVQKDRLRIRGIDLNEQYRSTLKLARIMRDPNYKSINDLVRDNGSIAITALRLSVSLKMLLNVLYWQNPDCENDSSELKKKLISAVPDEKVREIVMMKDYFDIWKDLGKVAGKFSTTVEKIEENFLIGLEHGLISCGDKLRSWFSKKSINIEHLQRNSK